MKQIVLLCLITILGVNRADAQFGSLLKKARKAVLNEVTKDHYPASSIPSIASTEEGSPLSDDESVLRAQNDSKRKAYEFMLSRGISHETVAHLIEGMDTIGIYADSLGVMVPMQPTRFDGSGVKNMNTAIVKAKLVAYVPGLTGKYRFPSGKAHMRLYFSNKKENMSEKYEMFTSKYTIDNLMISSLDVKKKEKHRLLNIGSYSELGLSKKKHGASQTQDVSVEIKDLGNGIYDVFVEGPSGEYCLIAQEEGKFPFNTVFDFSLGE